MKFEHDFIELYECLACGSNNLELTLDLKHQPLANSYKKTKDEDQPKYPLAINRCKDCYHVQLTHAVKPDLMFKEYLYVSGTSLTMLQHFEWFANYTTEYFQLINKRDAKEVMDIGCNDGSQLDKFKKIGLKTFGIDPAENLHALSSKNHHTFKAFFDVDFVKTNVGKYDIITAQNVFAHNYDPLGFLQAATEIMEDSSLLFIQTSQADMIKNNEFDTIYHEHISFYNINSMNKLCGRANLNLIDVIKCPLHGNSYIFVISKSVIRQANIHNAIDMESKLGLLSEDTYILYGRKCDDVAYKFTNTILKYAKEGYTIIGYGAAAKGMTLLNYSGAKMNFIIDDNKLKQNLYTPGSSIPIVSSDALKMLSMDDKVLFVPLAWNFFDEIKINIEKRRDNPHDLFLRYFPEVRVTK